MAHGNDVVLKCFANGGTPPLSYKWAKISGHAHPYRAGSYLSQHTFQSELSYQESFHSSVNQGAGARGRQGGRRGRWPGGGASLGRPGHQVKPSSPGADASSEAAAEAKAGGGTAGLSVGHGERARSGWAAGLDPG